MNTALKACLASAALVSSVAVAADAPAVAGDLGRGSYRTKDFGYVAPRAAAGPCYFRGDVGYSVSQDPSVRWPVNNEVFDADHNANGIIDEGEVNFVLEGNSVSNVSIENTWLAEGGIGCGSGSRGFRAELMFGYRGDRKIDGEPAFYRGTLIGQPTGTDLPDGEDPLHTSVQSYTLMANFYKDVGNFNRFVPYVGAGVGVAYHTVDDVDFTENPNLIHQIRGEETLSFAWSLMAGVGYQISERAILDLGYRYINMGDAKSGDVDSGQNFNPEVKIDDLDAHEFKIGLRISFGGRDEGYMPMK